MPAARMAVHTYLYILPFAWYTSQLTCKAERLLIVLLVMMVDHVSTSQLQ
jgi:hypothetical protein